jgi:hypothetical protein
MGSFHNSTLTFQSRIQSVNVNHCSFSRGDAELGSFTGMSDNFQSAVVAFQQLQAHDCIFVQINNPSTTVP